MLSLLDLQSEVVKEANSVLKMICTSRDNFWSILYLSSQVDQNGQAIPFKWDTIFSKDDIKLTMYNYDIIDAIIRTYVMPE